MKKFLLQTTLFALVILAILVPLEWIVATKNPNIYRHKINYITENGDKIKTMPVGSSLIYDGIRSEILADSCFNFGINGQSIETISRIFNHAIEFMPNLKTVVVEISVFTFFQKPGEYNKNNFINRMIAKYDSRYTFFPFLECTELNFFSESLRNIILGKRISECDKSGNKKHIDKNAGEYWDQDFQTVVKAQTYSDFSQLPRNKSFLEDLIHQCHSRNVNVVIVTPPAWKEYYNRIPTNQVELMYSTIKEISSKHNIPAFDYFKDPRFGYNDFWDVNHLNETGARKFTEILKNDINNSAKQIEL